MVQARSLLVAIALTVTVPPALAVELPTCDEARAVAQQRHYTLAKVVAMAKRHRLTDEQLAQVLACLGDIVK